MNVSTLSLKELKVVAIENGVEVVGNKSYKATWITAINNHFETAKALVIESNIEALEITDMSVEQVKEYTQENLETFGSLVFSVVNQIIVILKSEEAVKVYKSVAKFILITFILAFFYSKKGFNYALSLPKVRGFYMSIFYVSAMGVSQAVESGQYLVSHQIKTSNAKLTPYLDIFK